MSPSEQQELLAEIEKTNAQLIEVNKSLNALLGFLFLSAILFAIFK